MSLLELSDAEIQRILYWYIIYEYENSGASAEDEAIKNKLEKTKEIS